VKRRLLRVFTVLSVVVATSVLAAAPYAALVAHRSQAPVSLPRPAGSFPVGRVEDTATDSARQDRLVSVWTWYPALEATGTTAVYAPGAWSGLQLGLPIGETRLDRVHDNAREAATPAPGTSPVIVLLPGLGFAAPQYAAIAEDLASRGYVVAGVTPTGSANLTVIDGHPSGPTKEGNPSDFTGEQTAHDRAIAARLLPTWVGDGRLAARTAGRLSNSAVVAAHVDPDHVAYVGHSFGGTAALEACHQDAACVAAADIDGPIYGSVATAGLTVPLLLVAHDGSCTTGECAPHSATDRADAAAANTLAGATVGPTRRATISDTGHLDFTDDTLYYWAWPLRKLLGLGDADGPRTLAQVATLISSTVDRSQTRHQPAAVHRGNPPGR
jgi:dienelactone hydrolase